jgi:hypothetical protein
MRYNRSSANGSSRMPGGVPSHAKPNSQEHSSIHLQKSSQINSSTQVQPASAQQEIQAGMHLYQEFNHFQPSQLTKVQHCRQMPPVVVELGELVGVIYRSDKGSPGYPRVYIHRMEDPPRLVSNVEGTQLYIVGGSYRITEQGIEG